MKHFFKKINFYLLLTLCLGGFCIIDQKTSVAKIKTVNTKTLKPGAPLPWDIFIKMAKVINPTVVNISTSQIANNTNMFPQFNDPFFDFFFAPYDRVPRSQKPVHSLGTGFVIRSDGLILTNTHVVNKADTIQVQFQNDKKLYTAKLIGQDIHTDIALIKINTKKELPFAQLGNSGNLQVGEWVAAFGNPYGHGHTMTKGIISAVNREIDELNLFPFLQTDAIINPGNSGGPLVNLNGEVIGINTAMRTQGISFAIPIDNVKVVLKDLEQHGRIRRGFIGVQIAPPSAQQKQKGAMIAEVISNTPAEKSGLKKWDIITAFNKKKIMNYKDLLKAVSSTPVNQEVSIEVIRSGKKKSYGIKVVERQSFEEKEIKPPVYSKRQKAPFNLGLVMTSGTKEVLKSLGLPPLKSTHPVVTEIKPGSSAAFAGFRKNDIILKVNNWSVHSARDVQRRLSRNRTNVLNVLRYRPYSRQYVALIFQLTAR